MLSLTTEHISAIEKHGERDYPHECCGLLIGRFHENGDKEVVEILSIDNASAEETRHNRSLILPRDLLRGERYAREKKLDVIGNYHSHPDDVPVPSQFDLDHALPVWSYIIVSVQEGKAADMRSWELEADRSKFNEEEIRK
jgi:proteasome lid subunit RPN8/RPN11